MKPKIAVICGEYYPKPSPNGRCAETYMKLIEDEYDICVLCIRNSKSPLNGKIINNRRIYSLTSPRLWLERYFRTHANGKNKIKTLIFSFIAKVLQGLGLLQSIFIFPNNLRWFAKKAEKKLNELYENGGLSAVFAFNSPFCAHMAGYAFCKKHPDVKFITYTVDALSADVAVHNIHSREYRIKREKEVLCAADTVFFSPQLYSCRCDLYLGIEEKTFSLAYVLPPQITSDGNRDKDTSKIHLVFTGRFYRGLREPYMLLNIFKKLCVNNSDFILHLYCYGEFNSQIDTAASESHGCIIRHEPVSIDEIGKIYADADILVDVGNASKEFFPSKVYEYFAAGKPIVHLCSGGSENEIFNRYPLSLQLLPSEDENENCRALENFCRENQNKTVTREELEEIFNDNTSAEIKTLLLSKIGQSK